MESRRCRTPVRRMKLADLQAELAVLGPFIRDVVVTKQARMREILDELERRRRAAAGKSNAGDRREKIDDRSGSA